jgi:tRNA A37 threonylcarbamoyladenosine dehydratase
VKKSDSVNPFFQRLALLAGDGALEKLARTNVLVFGTGGVGGWCAEALARSGVGKIGLVDFDTVCESNVNRQVQATSITLGRLKVEALKERLQEINPACEVASWAHKFSMDNADEFGIGNADYIIDAIDMLANKIDLIKVSCNSGARFFSSMGMALRLDPTRIKVAGIWETRGCSLARLVRQGLRKQGFSGNFTVVYSDEPPLERQNGINGSSVCVTATAGMVLASLVLRGIMEKQ